MRRAATRRRGVLALLVAAVLILFAVACGGWNPGEGFDTRTMPQELRGEYDVFAQRCSKCHSLSRALNSGIDDDEFWRRYVERMRHQPASGINADDQVIILRFLHYYAETIRKAKASHAEATPPAKGAL